MIAGSEHTGTLKASLQRIERLLDAHVAILAAAAMDQNLERALLTKMRPLPRDMKDRLFDGYGPLAHFAAKIDIAYALDIISKEMYNDLRTINRVRVRFVHPKTKSTPKTKTIQTFQDPEIAVILDDLQGMDTTISDIKIRYLRKVQKIDIHLDYIYVQHCKAIGQTPTDVDASLLS